MLRYGPWVNKRKTHVTHSGSERLKKSLRQKCDKPKEPVAREEDMQVPEGRRVQCSVTSLRK